MKAKYYVLYEEEIVADDGSVMTVVRLQKWCAPCRRPRYIMEYGTIEPWEQLDSWLEVKVELLDGCNEAQHIRAAVAKFDELTSSVKE